MPYDIDVEPVVIKVTSQVALPPGNVSGPEWTAALTRVTDLENRDFSEFGGVDLSGAADGDVLLVDDATGMIVPGTVDNSLRVDTGAISSRFGPISIMSFRRGLTVNPHPDGSFYAIAEPRYGTGPDTVAEGDHTHQLPGRLVEPITPGGYMSGGTRTLATRNVTLPAGKSCLVEARIDMQIRGGDPGPCYYRLNLTIGGNTRSSGAGESGFWGVAGVPGHPPFSHARTITGTGSAISVSASVSYYGGGGFYTDAGDLVIDITYNR